MAISTNQSGESPTLDERVSACEKWIRDVQRHWDEFNKGADARDEASGMAMYRDLLAAGTINRYGEQLDNSRNPPQV